MNNSPEHGIPGGEILPSSVQSYESMKGESSPRHRANIIFLSYRFSQGGIGTQNRLLTRIEEQHIPNLFSEDSLDEVKELTQEMVGSYFLNQSLHPATAIPWEDANPATFTKTEQLVINELTDLFERFRDRRLLTSFDNNLENIAQSVIVMDADYLNRPGGRGGDSEKLMIKVDPYERDSYESTFIKYGVLKTSTNTREFDDIFHGLATKEVLSKVDPVALRQLIGVVTIYENKHPNLGLAETIELARTRKTCEEFVYGK